MKKNNIIIAVVGLCGSGKSEAVKFFIENNFKRIYFGDVTFDEMRKRNLEMTQENERLVREELRSTGDMAIYAKLNAPKIKELFDQNYNVVVESLYSWSEYKYIKEIYKDNFKLLAIVTDRDIRAKRIGSRETRALTDEQVTIRDYAEIENIEKAGPIAIADHFIVNNSDMQNLKTEVQKYIDSFK